MISNNHFKKKLGSTIWILKKGRERKKRGKLLRQFLAKFDCNLLLHETLKEGGELRL